MRVIEVIIFWLSEVCIHCEEWGSHLGAIPLTNLQPLVPSKMAKNESKYKTKIKVSVKVIVIKLFVTHII